MNRLILKFFQVIPEVCDAKGLATSDEIHQHARNSTSKIKLKERKYQQKVNFSFARLTQPRPLSAFFAFKMEGRAKKPWTKLPKYSKDRGAFCLVKLDEISSF